MLQLLKFTSSLTIFIPLKLTSLFFTFSPIRDMICSMNNISLPRVWSSGTIRVFLHWPSKMTGIWSSSPKRDIHRRTYSKPLTATHILTRQSTHSLRSAGKLVNFYLRDYLVSCPEGYRFVGVEATVCQLLVR